MEATKIKTTPKQTLTLTLALRKELKNPLGNLIKGTHEETMKELAKLVLKEKSKCIITVGDVVSKNILGQGIHPKIVIVDNKVMREKSQPVMTAITKKIRVQNPAGTLTPETWLVVKQALRQKQPTHVIVEGEEDLLTLVAILEAPENSLVVYGQPNEGIVAVKVNRKTKRKVEEIIDAMESNPKS